MAHCPADCPTISPAPQPADMIAEGMALIGRGLRAWVAMRLRALDVARAKRDLRALDDRMLADIGLRRDDIETLFDAEGDARR